MFRTSVQNWATFPPSQLFLFSTRALTVLKSDAAPKEIWETNLIFHSSCGKSVKYRFIEFFVFDCGSLPYLHSLFSGQGLRGHFFFSCSG